MKSYLLNLNKSWTQLTEKYLLQRKYLFQRNRSQLEAKADWQHNNLQLRLITRRQ